MENNSEFKFEIEVIERLVKIEQKLDDYKDIQNTSREADHRSKTNEERIEALEDRNKWLSRTMIGAIICEIIGLGFLIFQNGLGG
ncbi:MAG: hemolysin XhlA family protein [Clostridia bacterium]|nr:hemolysin XhlA family protein [Clostridia bacterium]